MQAISNLEMVASVDDNEETATEHGSSNGSTVQEEDENDQHEVMASEDGASNISTFEEGNSDSGSESDSYSPSSDEYEPPGKRLKGSQGKGAGRKIQRMSVTLGLDFEDESASHGYKVLMDSSSDSTKALLNSWTPSVPFQWLASRFVRRRKSNYFLDSWDIVRVTARELGYDVVEFLNFRGWAFHRSSKDQSPHLRYHRFHKCVDKSTTLENKKGLIHHFNAMLVSLFSLLKDAYERFPSSSLRNFEKDYSTQASFRSKVNCHVQVYHLCYAITVLVFGAAATVMKLETEQLVHSIFGHLKTRPKIISALNNLLRIFPSEEAIQSSQPDIVKWLGEPSLIVRKIQSMPPGLPAAEYAKSVTRAVDDELPASKINFVGLRPFDRQRNYKKNVAVVRLQVLHLSDQATQQYEKGKLSKKRSTMPANKEQRPQVQDMAAPLPQETNCSAPTGGIPVGPIDLPVLSLFDETPLEIGFAAPVGVAAVPVIRSRCSKADVILSQARLSNLSKIRVATRTVMSTISSVLISDSSDLEIRVCELSPLEVYFHADLKTINHRVTYLQDEPNLLSFHPGRALQWIPLSVSVQSYEFTVLRQDHPLFIRHFAGLQCDHLAVLQFLSSCGTTEDSRDGEGQGIGLRHDFGVGNQSFDLSDIKAGGAFYDKPNCDCGMAAIQSHPKANIILRSIGKVADALQLMFDDLMQDILCMPRQQDNEFRNSFFSDVVRKILMCQHTRKECGTLLAKCLTAGHYIAKHLDKNNCTHPGYRHTFNMSLVIQDDMNLYWRLSYLFNLRQACGDYVNRENGVKGFLSRVDLYLHEIDVSYQRILKMTALDIGDVAINWNTYDALFLCDHSPWEETTLSSGVVVEILKPRAAVTRDYWFSMATDVLRKAIPIIGDDVYELLLIALYQSGWLYFYLTLSAMLKNGTWGTPQDGSVRLPGLVASTYCDTCASLFQNSFHCGVLTRFQMNNIDFRKTYLNSSGIGNVTFNLALTSLLGLRNWSELFVGCSSAELQFKFGEVLPNLPSIGEFRLQMFLPLCGLSGLLKLSLANAVIAFPSVGRGSYLSITDLGIGPDKTDQFMRMISRYLKIDPHIPAWAEAILCESRDSRSHVVDVLIRGQSLSTIRVKSGGVYVLEVKEYNERRWTIINLN